MRKLNEKLRHNSSTPSSGRRGPGLRGLTFGDLADHLSPAEGVHKLCARRAHTRARTRKRVKGGFEPQALPMCLDGFHKPRNSFLSWWLHGATHRCQPCAPQRALTREPSRQREELHHTGGPAPGRARTCGASAVRCRSHQRPRGAGSRGWSSPSRCAFEVHLVPLAEQRLSHTARPAGAGGCPVSGLGCEPHPRSEASPREAPGHQVERRAVHTGAAQTGGPHPAPVARGPTGRGAKPRDGSLLPLSACVLGPREGAPEAGRSQPPHGQPPGGAGHVT